MVLIELHVRSCLLCQFISFCFQHLINFIREVISQLLNLQYNNKIHEQSMVMIIEV